MLLLPHAEGASVMIILQKYYVAAVKVYIVKYVCNNAHMAPAVKHPNAVSGCVSCLSGLTTVSGRDSLSIT